MTRNRTELPRRVLAVLGESSIPVTTASLTAIVATGLSHPRQRVYTTLDRLEAEGLVRRYRKWRLPDAQGRLFPQTCWSLR